MEPLTTKQKSVVALLLPVFEAKPRVQAGHLANEYQKLTRKSFSPRAYDFKNTADLVKNLDIFDDHGNGLISLSEVKLLNLLVKPLLHVPGVTKQRFMTVNGFEADVLCRYCRIGGLQQLMEKCKVLVEPTANTVPPDHVPERHDSHDRSPQPSLPPMPQLLLHPSPHARPGDAVTGTAEPADVRQRTPLLPSPRGPFPVLRPPFHQAARSELMIPPHPPPPQLEVPHNLPRLAHPSATANRLPPSSFTRHPNPGIPPEEETFLPTLPDVRPEMDVPTMPAVRRSFPSFSRRESKGQAVEKLEIYLQNQIAILSSQGKHLPAQVVNDIAKDAVNRANSMLGRWLVTLRDVKCTSEFSRLYSRVLEFIRCFCWNSTITSLFELQKAILILEKSSNFEDLQMGPILTHPLVKDLFKPPLDLHRVPEITAYEIQTHLAKFIYKHRKGEQYDMSDFLSFLAREMSVSGPEYLCIRITSFPLALSVSRLYRMH